MVEISGAGGERKIDLGGMSEEDVKQLLGEIAQREDLRRLLTEALGRAVDVTDDVPVNPGEGADDGDEDDVPVDDDDVPMNPSEGADVTGSGAETGGVSQEQANATSERHELVAVNMNLELDMQDAAHKIAEQWFEENRRRRTYKEDGTKRNIFARAALNFFGGISDNMFRETKIIRGEKKALKLIRRKQMGENVDLSDADWTADAVGAERFARSYIENISELVHEGESREVFGVKEDEHGRRVVVKYYKDHNGNRGNKPVDQDSREAQEALDVYDLVRSYAKTGENGARGMTEQDFLECLKRDKYVNGKNAVNYLEVAKEARRVYESLDEITDHAERMRRVMDGFAYIDAEARRDVRGDAEMHRSVVNRITNTLATMPVLRVVPAEVIAGVGGVVSYLLQGTARTALRAMAPGIGGLAFGGITSYFRESNRVVNDRAKMMNRLARGETEGDGKYDKEMAKTMYETISAKDSIREFNARIQQLENFEGSDDEKKRKIADLTDLYAEVEAAVRLSDRRGIDLIEYSGGEVGKIDTERMDLDVARAKAKKLLGQFEIERLRAEGRDVPDGVDAAQVLWRTSDNEFSRALEDMRQSFEDDIDAKDRIFNKLRRGRAVAQSGKTLLSSAVTMVATQEIMAAFDPNRYGIFDKVFNLKNNENPKNTMLAGALGFKDAKRVPVETYTDRELTPKEVEEMRAKGYTVEEKQKLFEQPPIHKDGSIESVSGVEYARAEGLEVRRDGWAGNNEVGIWYGKEGQLVSHPIKEIHLPNGSKLDWNQAVSDGKIRAYISPSYDTQGTPIVIEPQIINGQLDFSNAGPEVAQMMKDGTYKFFEVAYDNGNVDGVQHIIPLSTVVGKGTAGESIFTRVTEAVDIKQPPVMKTVYDVTIMGDQTTDRAMALFAGLTSGLVRRRELTRGRVAPPEPVAGGGRGPEPQGPSNPEPQGPGNPGPGGPSGGGEGAPRADEADDDVPVVNPEDDAAVTGTGTPEGGGGDTDDDVSVEPESGNASGVSGEAASAGAPAAIEGSGVPVAENEDNESEPTFESVMGEIDRDLTFDWDQVRDGDEYHEAGRHLRDINIMESRLMEMRARQQISLDEFRALFNAAEQKRMDDRNALIERITAKGAVTREKLEAIPERAMPWSMRGNVSVLIRPGEPIIDQIIRVAEQQAGTDEEEPGEAEVTGGAEAA